MAIERKNSFHLLLSDDELKLLKLLAETEGLNASDYLRMMLRRPTAPHMTTAIRITELLGEKAGLARLKASHRVLEREKKKPGKAR